MWRKDRIRMDIKMKARKVLEYTRFGAIINYLRFLKGGFHVHGSDFVLGGINSLFKYMDKFELKTSKRTIYTRQLKKIKDELEKKDESYRITEEEAEKIKGIMHDFYITLKAEISELEAYIITEKRLNVDKLINDIKSLMAPNVFDELNSIAQYDFNEAGKCIAFDLPTAAAFHSLRGIEGTLRMFFELITKTPPLKLMWNGMVSQLRTHTSPTPNEILDHLDSIRRNYRNPTAHPDKIYDIDGVQDLFSEAIAVINQMVKYLKYEDFI